MSGYTFETLDQLKAALLVGDVQSALGLVPKVDIEDDEYEYVALIGEFQQIFLTHYKDQNQLALDSIIDLISQSEDLYFSSDWPQFTDLISNLIAVIAELESSEGRDSKLEAIMTKLDTKDGYVSNHENVNYNLACFYATKEDTKTMMEYVLRASFSFDPEKFYDDPSFEKYKDETFFREPLEDAGHTYATWWTNAWPIEEWYED